jgi:hypothetical protein
VFLTTPKDLADMIDHYADRLEIPANSVVTAAMTIMHHMIEDKEPHTLRFLAMASEAHKRERDLSGLIVAKEL